jgi:hypothetical protein
MKEKINKIVCPACNGMGKIIPFDRCDAGFNGYVNCGVCSGSGMNMNNIISRINNIFSKDVK